MYEALAQVGGGGEGVYRCRGIASVVSTFRVQCPVFLTNLEGKVGKVGKVGRVVRVGKVGKVGKEG